MDLLGVQGPEDLVPSGWVGVRELEVDSSCRNPPEAGREEPFGAAAGDWMKIQLHSWDERSGALESAVGIIQ